MPTLDFKGKSFIYTHHLGVPYRELLVVPEKSCPAPGRPPDLDDNLILHGDNLEALKALLPRYAGRVDCIYIDPPYNTGTEGWCYNDAVNAPLMREWLKKAANPVERDDLQRHDKWLCMMWPRLQLLKELLAEDGAIFVSIDDNEVHRLRAVMDEVFGEENCVGCIVWEKGKKGDAKFFSETHEYMLVFVKNKELLLKKKRPWRIRKPGADRVLAQYDKLREELGTDHVRIRQEMMKWFRELPDSDPAKAHKHYNWSDDRDLYFPDNFHGPDDGRESRPRYDIIHPVTGKPCAKPSTGWRWDEETTKAALSEVPPRIHFGVDETTIPNRKTYFRETDAEAFPTVLYRDGRAATLTLESILGKGAFNFPKDHTVLADLIGLVTRKDSLILDSFAGSGTTAHAVLALNAKDGGNRRFILCETEAYADTLTAERVRRVIRGYDYTGTQETELHPPEKVTWTTFSKDKNRNEILERIEGIETLERGNYDKIEKKITDGVLTIVGQKQVKSKMPGLGGSFTYLELGEAMDLERLLAETPGTLPSFPALARYLFFTATGHTLPPEPPNPTPKKQARGKTKTNPKVPSVQTDDPVLIGEDGESRIYLHYRPDEAWLRSPAAAFTRTQAEAIANTNKGAGKKVIVFAAAKFINHRSLQQLAKDAGVQLDFAQLPYALHRVQAE